MKTITAGLTQQRLKELLRYDLITGEFSSTKATALGTPNSDGYLNIKVDGVQYRAHRLAWLYVLGVWPEFEVDHEDRDPTNNRWINLRPATRSQNCSNRLVQRNSKSGVKGVMWVARLGKWKVESRKDRKTHYGGLFGTIEEAETAAIALRAKLHGEFA